MGWLARLGFPSLGEVNPLDIRHFRRSGLGGSNYPEVFLEMRRRVVMCHVVLPGYVMSCGGVHVVMCCLVL